MGALNEIIYQQKNGRSRVLADNIIRVEANLLLRRFVPTGYDSLQVRTSANELVLVVSTAKPEVLLENSQRRLAEIEMLVALRFGLPVDTVKATAAALDNPMVSASAQAEEVAAKISAGMNVRRAALASVRTAMRGGARGIEVTVAGKIRGARAKTTKFRDGFLMKSGAPKETLVDQNIRAVKMKQGILGVQVRIMKPLDKNKNDLPDRIVLFGEKTNKDVKYEKKERRNKEDRENNKFKERDKDNKETDKRENTAEA